MWRLRLKDLGQWYSGGTPPREDEQAWDGDVPWISAKDIDRNQLREPTAFITRDAALAHSRLMPEGSLLLIVRGMALAHGLPVVQTEGEVAFNQDLRGLVCSPAVNGRFAYYALLGARPRLDQHIDRAAHGTARVTKSLFAEQIRIPDLSRQFAIAAFLDRECSRISQLEAEVDLQVASLQDLLSEAFTAAFGVMDRSVPLRRVIRSIADGPFGSSLASEHYIDGEEVRVIRLGNVGRAEFNSEDRAYVASAYARAQLSGYTVRGGDVIVAGLGDANHPLGRACVVPWQVGPAVHKADCYRVVVDDRRCLSEYLALALSYGPSIGVVPLLARGSTRSRLNTMLARELPVPVATIEHQRRVVEEVARRRRALQQAFDELRGLVRALTGYRDALITEAVSGKLDVARLADVQLDESAHAAIEGERPEVLSA